MRERLKTFRKSKGWTQTEFGEKLGIGRGQYTNYEMGRVEVPEWLIRAVVKNYNVSELWLREGKGPMFRPQTRQQEITAQVGELITSEDKEGKALLYLILEMSPEERSAVINFAKKLVKTLEDN